MTAVASYRRAGERRQRELVTPEGLSLPLTVASRGARAGALLVDLVVIFLALIGLGLLFLLIGINVFEQGLDEEDAVAQAMRVGLRSAELLEWGLDYARRRSV